MKKILEKKISKMKGEPYKFDDCITSSALFKVSLERFFMAFRGTLKRLKLKKCGKKLFIGRRVKIKFGKFLKLGNCVTINDNVFINAMCKNGVTIGDNFSIGKNSIVDCTGVLSELGESLTIGNNVGISPNLTLFVRGSVYIGDDTIVGPNVTIIGENHCFRKNNELIRKQGTSRKGISIGKNCWIGAGAIILDGVTIGDNSIVGAGAVVTKNVNKNEVVVGIPARTLKNRLDYENFDGK